tara:strand:- start:1045 stop:1689 length:645 start_codon:yes stop_codon:yes gene_type:complete
MRDLNNMNLLGTIGREVKMFESKNGLAISNIPVTTVQQRQGKSEISTFHTVVCFGELATMAADFKVGDRIYASGKIQNDSYEKDGQKIRVTKIVASHIAKVLNEGVEQSTQTTPQSNPAPGGGQPPANFPLGESSAKTTFPFHDVERNMIWVKPTAEDQGCSFHKEQGTEVLMTCAWNDPLEPEKGGTVYSMDPSKGDTDWKHVGNVPSTLIPF